MAYLFDDFQKFGKEQLEVVTTSSSSLAKGWQTIAAELSEYSKKSFENGSAFLEKLLGAKTLRERHSDSVRICQDVFRGPRWICNENGRALFRPRQRGFQADRNSDYQGSIRQRIGCRGREPVSAWHSPGPFVGEMLAQMNDCLFWSRSAGNLPHIKSHDLRAARRSSASY